MIREIDALQRIVLLTDKIARRARAASSPLMVSDVTFGHHLPRRTLLKKQLNASDASKIGHQEFYSEYIEKNDQNRKWVNSCDLYFSLENNHPDKTLHVIGIYIESSRIEACPLSSFLEVPQGSCFSGECLRFAIPVDNTHAICQHYELVNSKPMLIGDPNYFETSTIELSPNARLNVSLTLISNQTPALVKSISIVYTLGTMRKNNNAERFELPLKNKIEIHCLSEIPPKNRYRLTWKREPPILSLEADESIVTAYPQDCRWDTFRIVR